jgi:hypothetical protein
MGCGRHIVEFEQRGSAWAEFATGFDASNLRYMRLFFPRAPNL